MIDSRTLVLKRRPRTNSDLLDLRRTRSLEPYLHRRKTTTVLPEHSSNTPRICSDCYRAQRSIRVIRKLSTAAACSITFYVVMFRLAGRSPLVFRQVEQRCLFSPQLLSQPQQQQQWTRFMGASKRRKAGGKKLNPFLGAKTKIYPRELVCLEVHKNLLEWKDNKPISPEMKELLPHIEEFIKSIWLDKYPQGANLRKLQRDIAFRMPALRPGKLSKEEIMPVLGHLEKEGLVKVRIRIDGHCLIYRPGSRDELEEEEEEKEATRITRMNAMLANVQGKIPGENE